MKATKQRIVQFTLHGNSHLGGPVMAAEQCVLGICFLLKLIF